MVPVTRVLASRPGAKMTPGAQFVMESLRMPEAIADADLILTGEGHLDAQSLHGKATVALARLAQTQGKHVAAICGQVSLTDSELHQHARRDRTPRATLDGGPEVPPPPDGNAPIRPIPHSAIG